MSTMSATLYSPELNFDSLKLDLDGFKDNSSSISRMSLNLRDCRSASSHLTENKIKSNFDKNLFTFKPKLNPKSNMIAQNFLSFYERQNIHTQKQLEIVSSCIIVNSLLKSSAKAKLKNLLESI